MSAILVGLTEDRILLTETVTYKLWENAGKKIVEAQLTADQISQIFQTIQQDMTAAGSNRTMVGKGMDAASAVNKAWEDLKTKVQNSGPIKNVDAMYDQAAEKLKQATGGDQGVMKYVQKYRDFAKKHPIAQGLIYSALIAAAGISGAGLGGAAALGLFKMVDKLLQGEKFSSAAYSGAKTGAMAYGASKVGDLIKGQSAGQNELVGKSPEELQQIAKTPVAVAGDQVTTMRGAMSAGEQVARSGAKDITSIRNAAWEYALELDKQGLSPRLVQRAEEAFVLGAKGELARAAGGTAKMVGGQLVKESVTLSESHIKLIFKHIENQHNLNEGLWDTVKGAAGKAVDYAKTKGQNLTTKVTADKLMQAWKKAGSPTDSAQVSALLTQNGVTQEVVSSVFSKMKIPTTPDTPAAQPAAKPAVGSAISQGVSQAQQSKVNPELQKRLAARKTGKPDYAAGLSEDNSRQDELQYAFQQAKKITSQIKNDRTVNEILTNIELLVEKYNIDKDAFQTAEVEVKNAQRQLEAAIYNLDTLFQDAMQRSQWDSDEISNEGQIYSTGGGAGEGRRKYKVKPAGL